MAALINLKTNLGAVTEIIRAKMEKLQDPEFMLRPVALNAIVLIHQRIHVDGKASDGNQIGEYSSGYLAVRSGIFKDSKVSKSGKVKSAGTFGGSLNKETGVFGGRAGEARPKYNRGTDKKVIISLTRQLEDDYAVIPIPPNAYGVGFNNPHNFDKSQWVQLTYDKKIFDLTTQELAISMEIFNDLVKEALK